MINRFLPHAASVLLLLLLIFVTVPLLAPVAFHTGHPMLGIAIQWLYAPFCHQLPQRSWFFFGPKLTYTYAEIVAAAGTSDPLELRRFYGSPALGWKVAWSDRMVSFYVMTPVFGALCLALRRMGLPIRGISVGLLVLALLPIVIDGSTHMLSDVFAGISAGGWRDTNIWLAVLTADRFPAFYEGDHFGTFNWWMRLITGLVAAWGVAWFTVPRLDDLFYPFRSPQD